LQDEIVGHSKITCRFTWRWCSSRHLYLYYEITHISILHVYFKLLQR
jgi:hypothetical protein